MPGNCANDGLTVDEIACVPKPAGGQHIFSSNVLPAPLV